MSAATAAQNAMPPVTSDEEAAPGPPKGKKGNQDVKAKGKKKGPKAKKKQAQRKSEPKGKKRKKKTK
jgi:hypothetical protein